MSAPRVLNRRNALRIATFLLLTSPVLGQSRRVPDAEWLAFEDPAEAGFDAERLKTARQTWESLPSSAFLVIADGAVVASWGDVSRRFMCHSVRKSFLSGLFGVYWDRGEVDLNKTLADLGVDDEPEPLLESEKQARILDLLKARSGVFHPAAYAGRTDARPRGSQGPGRFFAYNNWDFNTLADILKRETGADVFKAFDEHFAQPTGMNDWRVSDGYYHYERDKSRYPAYPFRLSARDAARFGLLFAREGRWGEEQLLSKQWVRRSSALYSIDDEVMGYGFMWWVYREPRFAKYGMYSALGVGNQMIAVLPEIDLVIVNRANTYEGENTPLPALLDLIEEVLQARVGAPEPTPRLLTLDAGEGDPRATADAGADLAEFSGTFEYPPPPLGMPARTTLELRPEDGYVLATSPNSGTFRLYPQADGSLHEEDSHERYVPLREPDGSFAGLADRDALLSGALLQAARGGRSEKVTEVLALAGDDVTIRVADLLVDLLSGETESSRERLSDLAEQLEASDVEAWVNRFGYRFLGAGLRGPAVSVFRLNTEVFPEAANTWDSLGEGLLRAGEVREAVAAYERSLELDPENENARRTIERARTRRTQQQEAQELDRLVTGLLADYQVPGVAVAILREGKPHLRREWGVRRAGEAPTVDAETIFQVASLTKPVVAYATHVLAKKGVIDLDRPLSEYVPEPYVDDERLSRITARVVLSHSTGFPNWRPGRWSDDPGELKILFDPGSDFRYSGEGYVYLQHVLETITRKPLDVIVEDHVLAPLGMFRSSFVWEERFESAHASPHDGNGEVQPKFRPGEPLAAGTLHTTATDYVRFLRAILSPAEMKAPLSAAEVAAYLDPVSTIPERWGQSLRWSSGWGVEEAEGANYFWQWGDDGPFKAFAAGSVDTGDAVVVLTNGQWGLDVARRIVERVLGERRFLDFRMVNYRSQKDR